MEQNGTYVYMFFQKVISREKNEKIVFSARAQPKNVYDVRSEEKRSEPQTKRHNK